MESAPPPPHPEDKPPHPVMDVVPPKPLEVQKTPRDDTTEPSESTTHQKSQKSTITKPPKQPGSGVGLAIFATIVIVLGLAALLVYAYLRTNNISLF